MITSRSELKRTTVYSPSEIDVWVDSLLEFTDELGACRLTIIAIDTATARGSHPGSVVLMMVDTLRNHPPTEDKDEPERTSQHSS